MSAYPFSILQTYPLKSDVCCVTATKARLSKTTHWHRLNGRSTERGVTSRRGNSIIEMSVVLPALLFVVMGVVEFGEFFYIRSAFTAAARDVARASCLATAVQTDPVTRATATLAQANVPFNSSWMTIVDASNSNATVSDVSAVTLGHLIVVTIQSQYGQIPNAYRPLTALTGYGVGSTKLCSGQCMMVKE